MEETQEKEMISRFQAGDSDAFTRLFDANERRILGLCLHILRSEAEAMDAAQEVFLRAFETLPNWRGEARFSTWLYKTAVNVCYERIRSTERNRKISALPLEYRSESEPGGKLENTELRGVLEKAIATLPDRQRMVFALRQYEGKQFNEIAELMEITEGGAKASHHKALLALRENLKEYAPELYKKCLSETQIE